MAVPEEARSVIVIFTPYIQHKKFQKNFSRLSPDLEKKFNSDHVIFVAERTILPVTVCLVLHRFARSDYAKTRPESPKRGRCSRIGSQQKRFCACFSSKDKKKSR